MFNLTAFQKEKWNVTLIEIKQKKPLQMNAEAYVPGAGLEPARPNGHKILSLACLPVPPSRLH